MPDPETVVTGIYRALASPRRIEILASLQQKPDQTAGGLADALGLHVNTIRDHLQRLIENGLVVARPERRTRRGRPQMLYAAAYGTDGEDTVAERQTHEALRRGDLMRAVCPDLPRPQPELQDQLDVLEDHLEQCGFEPTMRPARLQVELSGCPYPDIVASHGPVMCGVHLDLIRSVLARVRGPIEARELLPFVKEGSCIVTLGLAGSSDHGGSSEH